MPATARAHLFDDTAFDQCLPPRLQLRAGVHFTPVDVARHVARVLTPRPGMTVLDVGAGAGKFCLVAGKEVPDAHFVGVELRPHLARFASRLAGEWGLANVRFVEGDAFELDWSGYDAFYFYNPFAEQLYDGAFGLDHSIDFDPINFIRYVSGVQERLAGARLGTRVATYHGYGGPPLDGYDLVRADSIGSDRVELWIKTRESNNFPEHEVRS